MQPDDRAVHLHHVQCPCEERARPEAAPDVFADWVTVLVHEHRAALARIARREGLGAEDAFDVVQEAFASFITMPRAQALVAEPGDARRLLAALARNLARNRRRLHANARPHLADGAAIDALADGAPPADERLVSIEERARLAGCMGRLADVQRAVVTLRMLDELPGQDVARLLDIAPGHVAVLLHRAKASLLSCMTEA
jgi:RNA polymerase sigma-70 factor (ECF subfamily)